MTEVTKPQIKSETIRGLLITIVPVVALILQAFGVQIDTNDQNLFIDNTIKLLEAGLLIYGLILAYIGRKKATQPLGGFFK